MSRIVELLKKIMRPIYRPLKGFGRDVWSFFCINNRIWKDKKTHKEGAVKVGFVAQMPEVWDKQMDLFMQMLEDKRFDPFVIYVNHFDFVEKHISLTDNEDKKFYIDLYGEERVIDYMSKKTFSLKEFDYVFYDRPYNHYLPRKLRSYYVVKRTKICIINYSPRDWGGPFGNKDFARDVFMWFASNKIDYQLHNKEYKKKKYNKAFDVGYPAFEHYSEMQTVPGDKRILWTPRWSYDQGIGGSHFFEYINEFIKFKETHTDVSLVIRPHPLMFDNLLSQKMISEAEIESIKEKCAKSGILFDNNRLIEETFKETDYLVTDYSSIVCLFFVTGKPIIYCPTDVPINQIYLNLTKAMYITNSWNSIEKSLNELINREDKLKEKREQMVSDVLIKKTDAVNSILKILWSDYNGTL